MVKRYFGGVLSATQPTTSSSAATGMFSIINATQGKAAGNWPTTAVITWNTAAGSIGQMNDAAIPYIAPTLAISASVTPSNFTLSYSVVSGSLPPGLSLSSSGAFSGTPSSVVSDTTFTFTVRASINEIVMTKDRQFTITIYAPGVYTFAYTGGDQTLTIPANVTHALIKLWGAAGGGGSNGSQVGGGGGYAAATFPVTAGATYTVRVGGAGGGGCNAGCSGTRLSGGYGGGGSSYEGNGGGGGSYIFSGGTAQAT